MEFVFFGGHFEFCSQLVEGLKLRKILGLGTDSVQSENFQKIESLAK